MFGNVDYVVTFDLQSLHFSLTVFLMLALRTKFVTLKVVVLVMRVESLLMSLNVSSMKYHIPHTGQLIGHNHMVVIRVTKY